MNTHPNVLIQESPLAIPVKQLPESKDISKKTVKLAMLLQFDDACESPHGIEAILGDRYLYAHNGIFSRIRDAALRFRCEFTDRDSPLLRSYIAFPLFSLHEIIDQKTVPYVANTHLLRDMAYRKEDLALPVRFLLESMRHNYILHESSHLVAHQIVSGDCSVLEHCRSETERFVFRSLLTESFANTVERLASSVPRPPLIHMIFYVLNSYMDYQPQKGTVPARALEIFGLDKAFRLAFLSYIISNIIDDQIDITVRERVMDLVWGGSITREEAELVNESLCSGYRINTGFREETTRSYFRYFGAESSFLALKDMRVLMDDKISECVLHLISVLADLALPPSAQACDLCV